MREAHRLSDINESLCLRRSEEVRNGEELGALEAIDLEILLRLDRRPSPAAAAAAAAALRHVLGLASLAPPRIDPSPAANAHQDQRWQRRCSLPLWKG